MATSNERNADISDWLEESVNKEIRTTAIIISNGLTTSSAVRDGFLRGAFIVSVGSATSEIPAGEDKSGGTTINRNEQLIGNAVGIKYPTIFVQNNLPYSYRIMEDGYSEQTPDKAMSTIIQRAINR